MSGHARSLPVLMYHCINNYRDKLCVSPQNFEAHCKITAENGWRAVGLDEAEAFYLRGEKLPPKSFLITLDDGYLDNYVNAWPILKKYGHKAVVFAVANEITAATEAASQQVPLRPTLEDLWQGRVKPEDMPNLDQPATDSGLGYLVRQDKFFNWHEARAMEQSGVIAIAAHGLRHEAVFTGQEYQTFLQPGQRLSPFNRTVREMIWGMPWFNRESEFTSRAFLPNPELLQAVRELVPQDEAGAFAFFKEDGNLANLESLVGTFSGKLGRMETQSETEERISGIFAENQRIFERELGHRATSFCWPWGCRDNLSLELAAKHGFKVFFNVSPGPNRPGKAVDINRFNAKRNPEKMLNRLRIYSKPLLGALYVKMRI